jgi:integrase
MAAKKKKELPRTRGVFERPKGSGIYWIRYVDQYGALHREKIGPKSLAIDAYRKRKTQVREGVFFPEMIRPKREITFREMADLYLRDHSKVNKHSWKTDEQRLKRLKERFGKKRLSTITKQDVERFRAILAQELSEPTANRYMTLLKGVFNKAIEWGKAKNNPVRGIKPFGESHRIRFLTDEEEERLKAVFPSKYWPWVEVALHTGMRRGEQFSLRWGNVNFQTRTLTIPRSKHGEVRHIPMNDRVSEVLRSLPSRLGSANVFTSSNDQTPMDARNFARRVFVPAVKEAKIPDFRWHDLRHTFASRLVMGGTDIRTVQELLGHKTITMTMRYAHLSPGHKMDAVQRLANRQSEDRTGTNTDTKKKGAQALTHNPSELLVGGRRLELRTPGL